MSRFASSLSVHPLATHAVGEAVGDVLDGVGPLPDIAMLFVTAPLVGVLEDVVGAIHKLLQPKSLLGTTAVSVMGGAREVEEGPALALWAASFDTGDEAAGRPIRLTASPSDGGFIIDGIPEDLSSDDTVLLLADPFSFPVDGLLRSLNERAPGISLVGGLASAARGPGGNRVILNDQLYADGAVALVLDRSTPTSTVVSQGCRPIGDPFTVTASSGNMIEELGGVAALDRLEALVAGATDEERALLGNGVHIGIVANEQRATFERGDFVIRGVLGADQSTRAIAIGDQPPVGSVVQFQVRDAATASEDLHLLHRSSANAEGALVFTCNGRGTQFFGSPHHDAAMLHDRTDGAALAGMFCAGEVGPIGGVNYLHGFTASTLLFH